MRRTDFCLLSLRIYEHPRLIGYQAPEHLAAICFTTDDRLRRTASPAALAR
jgi:hypothetical protein